jgi:glycosyltransferase involved in cell wall biosynthesis
MAHFESLTVFFPMWNEEAYIRQAVGVAQEVCGELEVEGVIGRHELLIVDDASTDRTGAIADELAARDPRIRVVHHPVNRRLGGSLKSGLQEASGELVLYTDADLPFDLAELKKACRLLRIYGADIVSAYRHDRTGEGPRRALYSFVYNHLIRVCFGMQFRDVNFAFKLVRRRVLDHVTLESEGSFIDAELLIRAQRLGFQIIQFGVDYFPRSRGVSTLSSAAVIVKLLRELGGLYGSLRRLERLPESALRPPRPDEPAVSP